MLIILSYGGENIKHMTPDYGREHHRVLNMSVGTLGIVVCLFVCLFVVVEHYQIPGRKHHSLEII